METHRDHPPIPLPKDDFVLEEVLVLLGAPMRASGQHSHVSEGVVLEFRQLVLPLRGWNNWGATELPLYMDRLRVLLGAEVQTVQQMHDYLKSHCGPVNNAPDWNRIRQLVEGEPRFPACTPFWRRAPLPEHLRRG